MYACIMRVCTVHDRPVVLPNQMSVEVLQVIVNWLLMVLVVALCYLVTVVTVVQI